LTASNGTGLSPQAGGIPARPAGATLRLEVGDLVSATITGANEELTADSIQDPASLPSAPGQ
jgi:hypothetical protein